MKRRVACASISIWDAKAAGVELVTWDIDQILYVSLASTAAVLASSLEIAECGNQQRPKPALADN